MDCVQSGKMKSSTTKLQHKVGSLGALYAHSIVMVNNWSYLNPGSKTRNRIDSRHSVTRNIFGAFELVYFLGIQIVFWLDHTSLPNE